MRLKDNVLLKEVLKRCVAVTTKSDDTTFHGMISTNPTAEHILRLLASDTTREKIIDSVENRFDAPRDVIAGDVDRILALLRSNSLIED